jgi:GNAT superfamily N-acetyltransferase
VHVRPVRTSRDLKSFIDFPYRHYADDALWAPPLRRDVRALLSKSRNPFFDHGEAIYFLAERDGRVVGRIAAIVNELHNETHKDRVGFFGFFEAVNDPLIVTALIETAADWLRKRGHDTMRGPMSFSVNDECGLLIDGFDTPPTIMMSYNPPYYSELLEQAGFRKAKDLFVYYGHGPDPDDPLGRRLARGAEVVRKRLDLTIRPIDMARYADEVNSIIRIYNDGWVLNWGFVPMTEREINHLAKQFKPVVVPDLVPFVEKDGTVIAFGIAIPDLNEVLRSNRSGRMFPASLKLLWNIRRRKISRVRILLLGVHPAFQGNGIDIMLYHFMWTYGLTMNIRWGEAGWILEDNPPMNAAMDKIGFIRYKTYRLYDRPL